MVGAIDRSHVLIIAPKNDPSDYYNRKQFYSVVLQGVADARGHFIHMSSGCARSIHDERVLRISALVKKVEHGNILLFPIILTWAGDERRPLLVADPAYKQGCQ